jgi:hypothetical protein
MDRRQAPAAPQYIALAPSKIEVQTPRYSEVAQKRWGVSGQHRHLLAEIWAPSNYSPFSSTNRRRSVRSSSPASSRLIAARVRSHEHEWRAVQQTQVQGGAVSRVCSDDPRCAIRGAYRRRQTITWASYVGHKSAQRLKLQRQLAETHYLNSPVASIKMFSI